VVAGGMATVGAAAYIFILGDVGPSQLGPA